VDVDFQALLNRLRVRWYPSTARALAFYWLRTVSGSGYTRREWKALGRLVKQMASPESGWRETGLELRAWMEQTGYPAVARQNAGSSHEAARSTLGSDILCPYLVRLLNEWLPAEVAHLLVDETGGADSDDTMPVLAVARAIERLLARERLSPGTLEALLDPGLLPPLAVYPADVELLHDVVLFLLGRTEAPEPSILPPVLLGATPDSPFGTKYQDAVACAWLAKGEGTQELHVPIGQKQVNELLKGDWVRLGSILVTMDGRWWIATRLLEEGDRGLIVHQPAGRLQIEYAGDHVRLRIPWPEARSVWAGRVALGDTFQIFGREWHIERWEQDPEQTQLHLVFLRTLPVSTIVPAAEGVLRRTRPAAIDIAWASLEKALASSCAQGSMEAIEELRHSDLIPLGRALFGLMESVMSGALQKGEIMAARVGSIAYLQAELEPSYGRIPWRILPEPVRKRLLASRSYHDSWERAFEGSPLAPRNRTEPDSSAA
jgi:hypothetical protein